MAQTVYSLPPMQETQVRSLGREDPLEKGVATHSSVLAWRIPWTEEPGGLHFTGSQTVRHDLVTKPPKHGEWGSRQEAQRKSWCHTGAMASGCLPLPPLDSDLGEVKVQPARGGKE